MNKDFGWWLPDGDVHLHEYLSIAPEWQKERRVYQPSHLGEVFNATLRRRGVAIDVGSHIGFWSFFLAMKFEKVEAFEPDTEYRECFAVNCTAPNITLHSTALGDTTGMVKLTRHKYNSGQSHIDEVGDPSAVEIPIAPLDFYGFPKVDFIKIDVEGYEYKVLLGAEKTLLKHKPVVIIEQKNILRYGAKRHDAREYLESLGAVLVRQVVDDCIMGWWNDQGFIGAFNKQQGGMQ